MLTELYHTGMPDREVSGEIRRSTPRLSLARRRFDNSLADRRSQWGRRALINSHGGFSHRLQGQISEKLSPDTMAGTVKLYGRTQLGVKVRSFEKGGSDHLSITVHEALTSQHLLLLRM